MVCLREIPPSGLPTAWRRSKGPLSACGEGRGGEGSVRAVDAHPGGFEFGVFVEGMQRLVAAVARLLHAAERHGDVVLVVLVDVHGARLQRARHAHRAVDIARPHPGVQAVGAVVGNRHGFGFGLEANDRQHRAEDFFLRDFHAVFHAVEHRRGDVLPAGLLQRAAATGHAARALVHARLDIAEHGLRLGFIDQRAKHGGCIQRVGRVVLRSERSELLDEGIGNAVLHQQA